VKGETAEVVETKEPAERLALAVTPEIALLGSCIRSHEALTFAFHNVEDDHFTDKQAKYLWTALKRIAAKGVSKIDPVIIQANLKPFELGRCGTEYIIGVCEAVPHVLNFRHYAEALKNGAHAAALRKLYIKLDADPFDEEARADVAKLWDRMDNRGSEIKKLSDMTLTYTDTIGRRSEKKEFVVHTGYPRVDSHFGGLSGGNLIAVGARTSLGKTSLLLNIALKFLDSGLRVLFVSAEMVADELMDRITAMNSGVGISRLRAGELGREDMKSVTDEMAALHEKPLWCIEGGRMSITRVRQAIEFCNPSVVFIDFLQRFVPPNPNMNRAAYFSDLANTFKSLALEKKIIIFCASQLNRDIERDNKGKGRPPQLSDFKESGGIEESADIAIVLQGKTGKGVIETKTEKDIVMHILKNRNGPIGRIPFKFIKYRTKFVEEVDPTVAMDGDLWQQP
jgi:replicative DNA helicase